MWSWNPEGKVLPSKKFKKKSPLQASRLWLADVQRVAKCPGCGRTPQKWRSNKAVLRLWIFLRRCAPDPVMNEVISYNPFFSRVFFTSCSGYGIHHHQSTIWTFGMICFQTFSKHLHPSKSGKYGYVLNIPPTQDAGSSPPGMTSKPSFVTSQHPGWGVDPKYSSHRKIPLKWPNSPIKMAFCCQMSKSLFGCCGAHRSLTAPGNLRKHFRRFQVPGKSWSLIQPEMWRFLLEISYLNMLSY